MEQQADTPSSGVPLGQEDLPSSDHANTSHSASVQRPPVENREERDHAEDSLSANPQRPPQPSIPPSETEVASTLDSDFPSVDDAQKQFVQETSAEQGGEDADGAEAGGRTRCRSGSSRASDRKRHRTVTTDSGTCLLYTSPSPRDKRQSRMPSSA